MKGNRKSANTTSDFLLWDFYEHNQKYLFIYFLKDNLKGDIC